MSGDYVRSSGPVDGGAFQASGGIYDTASVNQLANAAQLSPSANLKLINQFAEDSITAKAGGGKTNARVLTAQVNRITVCATAADSVLLPPSAAGLSVTVINSGAASAQVFGAGIDTINGVATGTGVSQAAGVTVTYICLTAGAWFTLVGAVGGLSSAGLQVATVSVTSAQLKALKATPITVLAAPGAGKVNFVFAANFRYIFVTAPYTVPAASMLTVYPGTALIFYQAPYVEMTGFLDQSVNMIAQNAGNTVGATATNDLAETGISNQPWKLSILGDDGNPAPSEMTVGSGTLTLTLYYTTITLS